jgi:hypothetical protein
MPSQTAPPTAEAFWSQLANATVEGDVLRLASGTTFLGSSTLPDRMYIRADYVGLWAELQRVLESGLRRIVVSGNPGIGKSWFGLYVAFKLLSGSTPPTIVWEARLSGTRTLIRNSAVLQGTLDSFGSELADRNTWYLVDESVFPGPWRVEARTLVFSSPKRDNYRLILKATASTIRYLPVWRWDEIEACRQLLYPRDAVRTADAVQEAYLRWGGIPRFVLEKLADASAQMQLESAIVSSTNLSLLVRAVGEIDSAPESSHRISHIATSAPYVQTTVTFGSDYIKARVTELLLRHQREELFSFVSRESSPLFAQMRGDCFEALAHETLAAGGDFRTRLLTPPGSEEAVCSLAKTTLRRFSGNKPADLVSIRDFCAGDYCQPMISTFPVIDALILPSMLLQMTVSLQHTVDEPKLAQILEALSLETAELHFVVPPDKYYGFKAHTFKDVSLQQRIVQKAMCVSFDIVL